MACDSPPGLGGPSVWAAKAWQPFSQEMEREGGSTEGAGAFAPAAGSMGKTPAHPFKSHRPDVPCQAAFGL